MNKNDLVERLAEEHELTKAFARELVDSVFDMITTAASKGDEVSLFWLRPFQGSGAGSPQGSQSTDRRGREDRRLQDPEVHACALAQGWLEHKKAGPEQGLTALARVRADNRPPCPFKGRAIGGNGGDSVRSSTASHDGDFRARFGRWIA